MLYQFLGYWYQVNLLVKLIPIELTEQWIVCAFLSGLLQHIRWLLQASSRINKMTLEPLLTQPHVIMTAYVTDSLNSCYLSLFHLCSNYSLHIYCQVIRLVILAPCSLVLLASWLVHQLNWFPRQAYLPRKHPTGLETRLVKELINPVVESTAIKLSGINWVL